MYMVKVIFILLAYIASQVVQFPNRLVHWIERASHEDIGASKLQSSSPIVPLLHTSRKLVMVASSDAVNYGQ